MRSAFLALLATIAGLAMVGVGVYAIATGGDGDDDTSSTSTSAGGSRPAAPDKGSPRRDTCAEVGRRDPRLAHLDGLEMKPVGGETGTATAELICNGDTAVLIWEMRGLRETETSKYHAYVYNSRKDAKQVGTVLGSDGDAAGALTIGSEVDTTKYESLVFTHLLFGEFEERPRRIVFRAPL